MTVLFEWEKSGWINEFPKWVNRAQSRWQMTSGSLPVRLVTTLITAPKTRRLSHSCATIESADRAAALSAVRVTRDVDRSYTEWCVYYNTELLLNTGNSVLCSMCNGRCNRDITDWRNQRIVSHGLVFTSFTGFEVTAALFRYCCDIRVHYNCSDCKDNDDLHRNAIHTSEKH